jgi:Flp pilus assembly protein TadD
MDESVSRFHLLAGRYWGSLRRAAPMMAAAPAVIVLVALGLLLAYAAFVPAEIRTRYLTAARDALANDRIDLAKVYYGRLLEQGEAIDPQDRMNWAGILANNGEFIAAQRIVDSMAPEDRAGFGPAHRQKAIQLVGGLSTSSDPQQLERLQWHLKNIGTDGSVEVHKMWAAFYFAVGQPRPALERLVQAAERDPAMWFGLAGVATKMDDQQLQKTALSNAEKFYLAQLEKNPFATDQRDLLVRTLLAADRVDEAQAVIDQGLKLQDIPAIHRSAANVLLYRFDRISTNGDASFEERNRLLAAAFEHDPNYPEIYHRLVAMYQELDSADRRDALRENLEALIAEGNVTPFAHFSLGSFDWIDGDRESAIWHLEKAYQLDPDLLEVANNLAWVIAADEHADLDRAHDLASSVVRRAPDRARFRDTLATILMKQERWDEALIEYERLLPTAPNKPRIHANLAQIYAELGKESLANLHRDRAAASDVD